MDALPRLSGEQVQEFKTQLHHRVEDLAEELIESVENAAVGRLIADSEEAARRAIHDFGHAAYEAAVQKKIDAAEASFPPSTGNDPRSRHGPTTPTPSE